MQTKEIGHTNNITARNIVLAARFLSYTFRPGFFPFVGFGILLTFTYLNLLPVTFKLWVMSMVWMCTIALPNIALSTIRGINKFRKREIHSKHHRSTVYIVHIISYVICLHLCQTIHLPMFLGAIIVASLISQCVCVIVNIWHRISLHSAGTGLIIGALLAYSLIFNFNPLWWLIICIIVSGAIMSSRMVLAKHTLGQVLMGTLVGTICSFITVVML